MITLLESSRSSSSFENGSWSSFFPVAGNIPLIFGWIVWTPVIQQKESSQAKYWDLTERPNNEPRIKLWIKKYRTLNKVTKQKFRSQRDKAKSQTKF